jgi:hypothetical protein
MHDVIARGLVLLTFIEGVELPVEGARFLKAFPVFFAMRLTTGL